MEKAHCSEILRKELVIPCPHCRADYSVEWLRDKYESGKSWEWYVSSCKSCHKKFDGTLQDRQFSTEVRDGFWKDSVITLRLETKHGDLLLFVKGLFAEWSTPETDRYHYEEHTCPINSLRNTLTVLLRKPNGEWDTDPHGMFEYVGTFVPEKQPVSWDTFDDNLDDLLEHLKRMKAKRIEHGVS